MNPAETAALRYMKQALDILDTLPDHPTGCYLQHAIDLLEDDSGSGAGVSADQVPAKPGTDMLVSLR